MNAPRDLAPVWAELQASSLVAAAAMTGESVGTVALRRIRASLDQRHQIGADVWRSLPLNLRELLLTMAAPELQETRYAASKPWAAFTEDQRGAIGAYARWLVRSLQGVQWLQR